MYHLLSRNTLRAVANINTICIICNMKWYERAKDRMEFLGIKQKDLIVPLEVKTRGAVGHYLCGQREPSQSQIITLAKILKCSISWLLTGEEEENNLYPLKEDAQFNNDRVADNVLNYKKNQSASNNMKRDMDLIRNILKAVELSGNPNGMFEPIEINGHTKQQISYHIKILNDAGLLDAQNVSTMHPDGFQWHPGSLTWAGQEFIALANDDTIWDKAKEFILKPSASFTFDLLLEYLKAQVKAKTGL